MKWISIPAFFYLHFISLTAFPQMFLRSGSTLVDPRTLMPEQYVILPLAVKSEIKMNVIDRSNPYTSLELITDANGKISQILIQTDFFGELTCLAVSKNLESRMAGKNRPQLSFRSCLGRIQESRSSRLRKEAAVDCILRQLEHPDWPK